MTDPYNDIVRELFAETRHVAAASESGRKQFSAHGGRRVDGGEVLFTASIADDNSVQIGFRAWGCPHLIAACEYCCRKLDGQPAPALLSISRDELMETLAVPVEKTGIMILIEDTMGALAARVGAR